MPYWDFVEGRCLQFVKLNGPCGSGPIIGDLDQTLANMGKTHLQVVNDVTRVLSDLSGNAPYSHGRKYHGGPPLARVHGVYLVQDAQQSCDQGRLNGF